MYNYEMNVEYVCNGQIMEQFELVRPAVDNTPDILKPNLQFALEKMLEEIPGMTTADVVYIEQNRHLINYHLSNGNKVSIFVKVVPVPHVKLEVPPIYEDEEIEVQVALFAKVKVSKLAFAGNPGKVLGLAIDNGNYNLNGDGIVYQDELFDTGVQFHPQVDVYDTEFTYGKEEL